MRFHNFWKRSSVVAKLGEFELNWKKLFARSLKPVETEEPLDLFIYRPLSFLLVMVLRPLPISPNAITALSMAAGVAAGVFFGTATRTGILCGSLLLLLSNILDCADGQLARVRGTSSRLGKTLDGLADIVVCLSATAGICCALVRSSDVSAWVWILYSIGMIASRFLQIHLFDFFKNELIFYTIPEYHETLESLESLRAQRRALRKAAGQKVREILLSAYIVFYATQAAVLRLVLPSRYRGYLDWYRNNPQVPQTEKEAMRRNYRHYNRLLVRGWSLIGASGHTTVLILAPLFGRLDLALWIICVPFNLYALGLMLLQRLSLACQLRIAHRTAA
jgi:CDP-alcohol phosphatidyltransferase